MSDTITKTVTMLTTIDNPYDPFIQFDQWNAYDVQHGYFTCAYLARISRASAALPDIDEETSILSAIDEIIDLNVLGIYKKIAKSID